MANPEYGVAKVTDDSSQKPPGLKKCAKKDKGFHMNAVAEGTKAESAASQEAKVGSAAKKTTACFSCGAEPKHKVEECKKSASMKMEERKAAARQSRQWYRCLKGQHLGKDCKSKVQCDVKGCEKRHHTLLHGDEAVIRVKSAYIAVGQSVHVISVNESEHESDVLLMVVPVVKANGARTIETFAMLDGGSQITMVTEEIAKALKSTAPKRPLEIQWWQGKTFRFDSSVLKLEIRHRDGSTRLQAERAYTVPTLNVTDQRYGTGRTLARYWPHLQGLEIPAVDGSKVGILIGMGIV